LADTGGLTMPVETVPALLWPDDYVR
jgi:hypothetical protein